MTEERGRERDVLEPPLAVDVMGRARVADIRGVVDPGLVVVRLDRRLVVVAVLDRQPPAVLQPHVGIAADIDRRHREPRARRRVVIAIEDLRDDLRAGVRGVRIGRATGWRAPRPRRCDRGALRRGAAGPAVRERILGLEVRAVELHDVARVGLVVRIAEVIGQREHRAIGESDPRLVLDHAARCERQLGEELVRAIVRGRDRAIDRLARDDAGVPHRDVAERIAAAAIAEAADVDHDPDREDIGIDLARRGDGAGDRAQAVRAVDVADRALVRGAVREVTVVVIGGEDRE